MNIFNDYSALYSFQENVFGKARGRRLYFFVSPTDNAAKNIFLKAIASPVGHQ